MGVIGDISTLVLQAYKLLCERHAGTIVTPQEMFDKYVGPSYQLLKQVHCDYMDLYLELRERLSVDDPLSHGTVQWFARARARRQADRSELRLLDIPRLPSQRQRASDVNAAGTEYLAAVRAYFEPPEIRGSFSRARISRVTPSASSFTAARLHVLEYWSRLSPASQPAFAVEEHLESEESPPREVLVETLLASVVGLLDPDVADHVESVAREASAAFACVHPSLQQAIGQGRFPWVVEEFDWRRILDEHIRAQCSAFETSMGDVQTAYFRFRILADRHAAA
jgi:hypothetical protein